MLTIESFRAGHTAMTRASALAAALLLGGGLLLSACEEEAAAPPPTTPPVATEPPAPEPAPPGVPTDLRVSATGQGFIEWSWSPVEGAEAYQTQFSQDEAFTDEDELIERTAEEVSYRREDLPPGASGHLRVRASSGAGEARLFSDWSLEVEGTTDLPPGLDWSLLRTGDGLLSPVGARGGWLYGIAANAAGRFVAVGDQGTIAWSDDSGVHWTEAQSVTTEALRAVVRGGERFVAVGWRGAIVHSEDGDLWAAASTVPAGEGPLSFGSVAWGGGRFVAVDGGGIVAHSADGDSWTAASDTSGAESPRRVAWGGGRFVMLARDGFFHSDDGDSWERASDAPDAWSVQALAWGGGRFVGVGNLDAFVRSTDGVRWTEATGPTISDPEAGWPTIPRLHAVTWDGSRFLAIGDRGATYSSHDGDAWVEEHPGDDISVGRSSSSDAGTSFYSVAWNGDRFASVGYAQQGTSGRIRHGDGRHWEAAQIGETLTVLLGAALGGERFVATSLGQILYSDDGSEWKVATLNDDEVNTFLWWGVAHNGERFVATGFGAGSSAILYSEDGRHWETASEPDVMPQRLNRVVWTGTQFVAVGFGRSNLPGEPIFLSPDGVLWQAAQIEFEGFAWLWDVAAIGSRLVAGGQNTIYRSDDGGRVWTPATELPDVGFAHFRGVASSDNRFVAVASNGTIVYSDDGDRWTTASETGLFLRDVAWNGERFLAVGGNGSILHSDNGERWVSVPDPATRENLVGITWTGTHFLAVGYNGTIVVSPELKEE